MDREQVAKIVPVMQAFVEGKQIQYRMDRSNDTWINVIGDSPSFTSAMEWRVKPEPVVTESWSTFYGDKNFLGGSYDKRHKAESYAGSNCTHILHLTVTDGVPSAEFIPFRRG